MQATFAIRAAALSVATLGLACVTAVSCKGGGAPVPCVNMSAPSELVTRAAVFRIDVYPTGSHCDAMDGASGSPILTRTFAAGEPLQFNVADGRRPVVLAAWADVATTQLLGRACNEADLGSGRQICLDLTLVAPPDMSQQLVCDPATPATCGTGVCCDGKCRDSASEVQYCGGCRACAATNVATPMCTTGLCQSTCSAGFGNCVQPAAPAADDGCETKLDDTAANCGACGRTCASMHTTATSCAGSLCTSTCETNFGNCTQPSAPAVDDGCETDLTSTTASCGACGRTCSTAFATAATCASKLCNLTCQSGHVSCGSPAAPAADDGCECVGDACCPSNTCQLAHSNGAGQTFRDCVALNTHTQAQATSARAASVLVSTMDFPSMCNTVGVDLTPTLCRQTATTCACWGYDGTPAPGSGHVHLNSAAEGTTCRCPVAGDPTWN